jgi:uncharacterized membrane protein YhhN
MLIGLLLFWAFVFAVLTIHAEYKGPRLLAYLFRPLTMSLFISLVIEAGKGGVTFYRVAVGTGLVFSLGGDVFMMLKRKRFLEGLLCFLVAQVCYAAAFISGMRFRVPPWPTAVLLAFAATLFAVLYPRLGRMKFPVFLYSLVMLVMTAAAVCRYDQAGTPGAFTAAAGAVLFMLSDAVLAVNRFRKPFRSAQALILSAYFAAQGLIALSVCL